MIKFHKTDKGRIEPCAATVRACRYGEDNHFDNKHEAALAAMRGGIVHSESAPTVRQAPAVTPSIALLSRERKLTAAAQRDRLPLPATHRTVAAREEVFFNENGHETGNGVVVSRLYNGTATVRLPITHHREGEWRNVQLLVRNGETASQAFTKFLDGVEHEPPDTYRIVGTTEDGEQVVTTLSTEHYARLRAALRTTESILKEPLPARAPNMNSQLLQQLKKKGGQP